jgi:hypothetical protein
MKTAGRGKAMPAGFPVLQFEQNAGQEFVLIDDLNFGKVRRSQHR